MLDSSRFPLFHSGQVFHQLVCPLTVVLPQIFFILATLFSYSVFFSLFHASLDVVVHFLVFLRSFRLKSFLSQTRARWAEWFHGELNGHVFDLERDGLRPRDAQDSPCDDNTQPYHTESVAARVNKNRAFRHTPERRYQVCY